MVVAIQKGGEEKRKEKKHGRGETDRRWSREKKRRLNQKTPRDQTQEIAPRERTTSRHVWGASAALRSVDSPLSEAISRSGRRRKK